MDTRKDFILREIQKFASLLQAFIKQKPSQENVEVFINEFCISNFNVTLESILEKLTTEIVSIIENHNVENLKDFADILTIKLSFENDTEKKSQLLKIIIDLLKTYQFKTQTYSLDIQSKIIEFEKN